MTQSGNKLVKNIVISGTNFWNPGDDFVRDGVVKILKTLFPDSALNFLFYNFNQDFFPQSKFSGIHNMLSKGDLDSYRDFIDYIVIAGLSAGEEIKDLYNWIIQNNLQSKVYMIGAGYENDYVAKYILQEPEKTIFRNARVITGRTKAVPSLIKELSLPYHYINCPAILSVDEVKDVEPSRMIEKIGFSLQLPREVGVPNHSCDIPMYDLSIQVLSDLLGKYDIEFIAHHKSEYFYFLNLLRKYNLPVKIHFSSFYQDLYEVYRNFDLIITTRLHASLFANGFGIPGIVLNDTDRHKHTLEGFPHSKWVDSIDGFQKEFETLNGKSLHEISKEAKEFKADLLGKYVEALASPFGIDVNSASVPAQTGDMAAKDELPVHFFSIVLNGKPFIEYHINALKDLPFKWHWHIVEGVADLKHDTSWALDNGGRITEDLHKDGLSNDGTSEYLDRLCSLYPENVTIYRKESGAFWDGKLEMVSAPLENINEECLLWEIDSDELWTKEQITEAREMFISNPEKTAAFYYCTYFIGEKFVTTTKGTYGNHTDYEWLRTWRYSPGDRWASHEPPKLKREFAPGIWIDLGRVNAFTQEETKRRKLVFQHYAYTTPEQLKFKELYYGYSDASKCWSRLNDSDESPALLADFFPWVNDGTVVEKIEDLGIAPLAEITSTGWKFNAGTESGVSAQLPKTAADYLREAEAAINANDLLRARKLLTMILRISPDYTDAENDLAIVDIMEQKYESAAGLLDKILSEHPDNQAARQNREALDNILNGEGKPGAVEANRTKDAIMDQSADSELDAAVLITAEAALQSGDYPRAEEMLKRILSKNPSDIAAMNDLAVTMILSEDWISATDVIAKVLAIDPNNSVAQENLRALKAALNSKLTDLHEMQMNRSTSESILEVVNRLMKSVWHAINGNGPLDLEELRREARAVDASQLSEMVKLSYDLIAAGRLNPARVLLEAVLMKDDQNLDAVELMTKVQKMSLHEHPDSSVNLPDDFVANLKQAIASPEVKKRIYSIISRLHTDYWDSRTVENYRIAKDKGTGSFDALCFLNWYAHEIKPRNYLEVGVRRGRSHAQVAVESPSTQSYGFDMWIPDYGSIPEQNIFTTNPGPEFVLSELSSLGVARLPILTKGNSHETLPAFFANPQNPRYFDLMFIDGDHSYDGAKLDMDIAFDHLAPGGAIIFDDIKHTRHPSLACLWNEYKLQHADFLFIEDWSGTGTGVVFKPPFEKLSESVTANLQAFLVEAQ